MDYATCVPKRADKQTGAMRAAVRRAQSLHASRECVDSEQYDGTAAARVFGFSTAQPRRRIGV
ncbi:TPA: hypothetical protein QDA90_006321 [Burkholderia vietnamiensis]|nr:hypothetical protein [Burkholderia vietnamiensis]HDR8980791.1 hypothetical protein [Burkholderia vietnamiensis]HDR9070922.1 hypothetical protein [Burkholderia vietnamiensis]